MEKAIKALALLGRFTNEAGSFIVFLFLDILDFSLCGVYKLADFFLEAEWNPCYCFSGKEAIVRSGNIVVSERGRSKLVCLSSSKLHLEEISETLYTRASVVSQASRFTIDGLKRIAVEKTTTSTVRSSFKVSPPIAEMLQGKMGGDPLYPIPRWSDCDCCTCTSWSSSPLDSLYVRTQGSFPHKAKSVEDVLFIHGFISSSTFWTETVFPNFSDAVYSSYRLLAVDLLGFGRSPKPADSLYTLKEHVDMIEKSVMQAYKVRSCHIVAHSLGCILALAIAAKHPGTVKSLTLLSPPYFPVPEGEQPAQYVMRTIAPRRVWPLISFGASIACWYEHISRTVCLLICKNHRLWEFLAKLLTRNRLRTFLLENFFCHTHNAAWHTLHNIICGTAGRMGDYLDAVLEQDGCKVALLHGEDDELIPVQCSYNVRRRLPRASVKVIEKADHISIVVGRQDVFARELEEIWRKSSG